MLGPRNDEQATCFSTSSMEDTVYHHSDSRGRMGRKRERGASGQLQAIDRESIKKDFQSGRSDHRFHRLPNIPDEGGKYLFEHGGRKLVISVFSAERDRT